MRAEAKVITIEELAEYLRVHRSTLYRLLKKQQLPGFKIGGDWRGLTLRRLISGLCSRERL
jgi:excisionase family DNA binding protein